MSPTDILGAPMPSLDLERTPAERTAAAQRMVAETNQAISQQTAALRKQLDDAGHNDRVSLRDRVAIEAFPLLLGEDASHLGLEQDQIRERAEYAARAAFTAAEAFLAERAKRSTSQ